MVLHYYHGHDYATIAPILGAPHRATSAYCSIGRWIGCASSSKRPLGLHWRSPDHEHERPVRAPASADLAGLLEQESLPHPTSTDSPAAVRVEAEAVRRRRWPLRVLAVGRRCLSSAVRPPRSAVRGCWNSADDPASATQPALIEPQSSDPAKARADGWGRLWTGWEIDSDIMFVRPGERLSLPSAHQGRCRAELSRILGGMVGWSRTSRWPKTPRAGPSSSPSWGDGRPGRRSIASPSTRPSRKAPSDHHGGSAWARGRTLPALVARWNAVARADGSGSPCRGSEERQLVATGHDHRLRRRDFAWAPTRPGWRTARRNAGPAVETLELWFDLSR